MATSGSDDRRWLLAGTWQHHLIDPLTGAPSASPWLQVTVAGPTCLAADIAAKAAFVAGDDGPDWLDVRGFPGRFLAADGTIVETGAWRRALLGEAPSRS
jgi:thiamine biosynthesis lipoprotein